MTTLDRLARSIADAMPQGATDDMRRNIRGIVESAFERMDLVTREELDVQEAVLVRTRRKLEELEKRVAELESGESQPTRD